MDSASDFERQGTARVRKARRGLLVVVALCGGVGASVAAPASAAQSGANTTYTTPGEQTFTVPGGVTSLTVAARGAQGGEPTLSDANGQACPGGEGAVVGGVLAVSGGEKLYVEVGGTGNSNTGAGGYGGGGNAGQDSYSFMGLSAYAGGGGGASDVRTIASGSPGSAASRLLVAAGGGGDGDQGGCADVGGGGGNAGASPAAGANSYSSTGGGGASGTTVGGAGATSGCTGSAPAGGSGASGGSGGGSNTGSGACVDAGGGGGGGYAGGGGGGGTPGKPGTGGGAGSSYTGGLAASPAPTVTTSSASQANTATPQNGSVAFTYDVPNAPSASISQPASGGSYTQGQVVQSSFSCTEGTLGPELSGCSDNNGTSATISSGEQTTGTIHGTLNTGTLGPNTYTVTATSADGLTTPTSITYTVTAGTNNPPTATISSPANEGTYYQGEMVATSFSCSDGAGAPGLASCDDSTGTNTTSGGHGTLNTSAVGQHTYYVVAISKDGLNKQAQITYLVGAPPTATITKPASSGKVWLAINSTTRVPFSCAEGTGGPGLASCDGGYNNSGNNTDTSSGGSAQLDTSHLGNFFYTVTATSKDGATASTQLDYSVADPPTATIISPAGSPTYLGGEIPPTSFSCAEGAGGDGLSDCTDGTAERDNRHHHRISPTGQLGETVLHGHGDISGWTHRHSNAYLYCATAEPDGIRRNRTGHERDGSRDECRRQSPGRAVPQPHDRDRLLRGRSYGT